MYKLITIIPFLWISLFCFGIEYYVKDGGNDNNSGLNDNNAWAHHPWMITWTGNAVLKPGDVVYMKRGDSWVISNPEGCFMRVDQSGNYKNPIVTTAYGNGPAPLIRVTIADNVSVIRVSSGQSYLVFDNLHIKHCSSRYSEGNYGIELYGYPTPCHNITITNCEIDEIPHIAIFGQTNCYNIIIGDTTATKIATDVEYSNHIHNFGYAGVILQGANPADSISNFHVYYNYIHDAAHEYVNEYGIAFSAKSISAYWPRYAYARYNRVENIDLWEGIESHGGSYLYFTDNYIKGFGRAGIYAGADTRREPLPAICDHIYIERNIIEQTETIERKGDFIQQASDDNEIIPSDIYIRDNQCFYTNRPSVGNYRGIRVGNVNGLTISGNHIYNGSTESGEAGIYITHNYATHGNKNVTITGNFIQDWGPGIRLEGKYITGIIDITKNIIVNPVKNSCLLIKDGDIPATGTVRIYNNVFLGDPAYSRCVQVISGITDGGSVIAKNNILGWKEPITGYYWDIQEVNISGSFICDYNLYWHGNKFFLEGIVYDWEGWNSNGYDIHGLYNTNPLFVNKSEEYKRVLDFTLRSLSPAINAGTHVGIFTDFIGDEITELPDIGAFEAQMPNSIDKDKEIKIFPNPVNDIIIVRIDETSLIINYFQIVDISGRVVIQEHVNPKAKKLIIHANLPRGIYAFILESSNSKRYIQKLLIINN